MKWSEMSTEQRDALIAKKVMGLRVEHWTQKELYTTDENGEPVSYELRTGYVLADDPTHPPIPHYSTDMNAAWKIVEKITAIPQTASESFAHDMYASRFAFWFDKANLWAFSATEAATAICMRALLICRVEIEP